MGLGSLHNAIERYQLREGVIMKRPSAAIVIASAALFFSVTGVGFAAHHYLITSTSQIKPSVISTVRAHSVLATREQVVFSRNVTACAWVSSCSQVTTTATCPRGTKLMSGGYLWRAAQGNVYINTANGHNGWVVAGWNLDATPSVLTATALCGS